MSQRSPLLWAWGLVGFADQAWPRRTYTQGKRGVNHAAARTVGITGLCPRESQPPALAAVPCPAPVTPSPWLAPRLHVQPPPPLPSASLRGANSVLAVLRPQECALNLAHSALQVEVHLIRWMGGWTGGWRMEDADVGDGGMDERWMGG